MMKRNVSTVDLVIRLIVGIVLIGLGIWLSGWWWIAAVVGVVLIVTGVIRWCPIYRLFGISTAKHAEESAGDATHEHS